MSSEATQTVTVYDVLAWLESNKKSLLLAFIAAVVIGFGIGIYRYSSDQKELAASEALLKLKVSVGSTESTNPPPPSAFLRVVEQYPGTGAAERAALLAGTALFTDGKYAEAQAQFSKFLGTNAQSPFAATAAYGVAVCLEAQGKRDEALAAYQNLSVRYPGSSVLDEAKLATARINEAKNQPDLALRIYDELTRPESMSQVSSDAMTRKQELLAKHPELAKTNAPPVLASTSIPVLPTTNAVVSAATNATNVTNAAASVVTNATPSKP